MEILSGGAEFSPRRIANKKNIQSSPEGMWRGALTVVLVNPSYTDQEVFQKFWSVLEGQLTNSVTAPESFLCSCIKSVRDFF